jgi:hypothetical protein
VLNAPPAAALYRASGFVHWHETDMPTAMRDVRSRGQSRKHILAVSLSGFDPTRTSASLPEVLLSILIAYTTGTLSLRDQTTVTDEVIE